MESGGGIQRAAFSGSAHSLGRAHGEELRELVRLSIELYKKWFAEVAKLNWEQVLNYARVLRPELQAVAPDLLEEMHGIAEGANVSPEAIVALNCRTEIGYCLSGILDTPGKDRVVPAECSAAGIPSGTSVDGHTYIGQNWDWRASHLDITVLLDIHKTGMPRLLTLTEAGMVGKIGFNEHGVGLCFNLLATRENQVGMPAHVLARRVLEQRRLDKALEVVVRARRAGSGNFLLGYHDERAGSGEVMNLQWAPGDFNLEYPEDGFIARTNHFVRPIPGVTDFIRYYKEASLSTYVRLGRANRILSDHRDRGELGPEALRAVFSDHFSHPASICSHTDPASGKLGQTNASIIMDLCERTLAYTNGPPCEAEYERVILRG